MVDHTKNAPNLDNLRAHREDILQLAEHHGAYNVRVCGSVARQEATPGSDVDLLVSARPGVSMFDLVGLWLDLKDFLGCDVSLITDDDHPRHERFMSRIREDAVPL
ncbi:MAG: nucleotidyltransferase family protein [Anaerolineae bacterium]|nr:nucleotidyltransferase family protein [Anaerolineae bacterium]